VRQAVVQPVPDLTRTVGRFTQGSKARLDLWQILIKDVERVARCHQCHLFAVRTEAQLAMIVRRLL
jgi:hypothetical protein